MGRNQNQDEDEDDDRGMRLRFLGLVGETKLGPFLARHQVVVHAAAEVLLGDIATRCVPVAVVRQAAHIFDHGALAVALMIQRKAAALRRRRCEQFLRERVRGHITPRLCESCERTPKEHCMNVDRRTTSTAPQQRSAKVDR